MASDVTLPDSRELATLSVNYNLAIIAYSLLVYDYCLTFVAEVERFWSIRGINWASGLFYLNRYMVLVGHIPVMIEYFWSTSNPDKLQMSVLITSIALILHNIDPRCDRLQTYHQYLAVVIQFVVACMLIMRMYALYGRSRFVLALYICVTAAAGAIACWAIIGGRKTKKHEVDVPIGCAVSVARDRAIRFAAAWSGMLIFDSLVFGMTLYKSLTLPRLRGVNLISVLLRDGSMYFGIIMVSNFTNVLTFLLGGPFTRGVATTFTNVISSVMISRLMLNLRHPSLVPHEKCDTCPTRTDPTSLYFEHNLTSQISDGDATVSSQGRPRAGYEYLARDFGRPPHLARQDVELGTIQKD
ncbi:unnamed protein product [Cyclocybe aegerita]|uniref:DUF6533 domain-containing protein n=1 Tax=Cyclocybe aegerita TaxID=1973307 RepID=A0A8S0XYG1_CYCAE|nr:unnamed protein product [Cyclocybe aegerita]